MLGNNRCNIAACKVTGDDETIDVLLDIACALCVFGTAKSASSAKAINPNREAVQRRGYTVSHLLK